MQPQGQVQVLLNMLRFGLSPQAALDVPRVCIKSNSENDESPDMHVYLEDGISHEVVQGLRALGHKVQLVKGDDRGLFGVGQIIKHTRDCVENCSIWSAGSDPRHDGAAIPLP